MTSRRLRPLLPVIIALLLASVARAGTATDGDWEYSYSDTTLTATVTKYNGSASSVSVPSRFHREVPYQDKDDEGHTITLYRTVTYTVTAISGAFSGNTRITSVSLPSSVTTIGASTFRNCTSLSSAPIHSGITSIGSSAFSGCNALTAVTLPSSLTSLGSSAFASCKGLESAQIDGTNLTLASGVLASCTNLQSVVIGNGVTLPSNGYISVNSSPFNGDKRLRVLDVGTGVSSIGSYFCQELTGLETAVFRGEIQSIGTHAFDRCLSLSSISLGGAPATIGSGAFYNCRLLAGAIDLSQCKDIGQNAFGGCQSLEFGDLSLPSVTSIDANAFSGCNGLTAVTLPSSLMSLGSSAFSGCKGLTKVSLPDTLATIPGSCFSSCKALETVTIPRSVTKIESSAFQYDSMLTNVWFEGAPQTTGSYVFSGVATGARGHYPRSLVSEWIPKIDSNGKWNGLIMHELSQPVLRVKSASPIDGTITLAWDDAGDLPGATTYAVYRSAANEWTDADRVTNGLAATEWTDNDYWRAEPVLSPLNYWVVAENDYFDIPESNSVETRHRHTLSIGLGKYVSRKWWDMLPYNTTEGEKAYKQPVADALRFAELVKFSDPVSSTVILTNELANKTAVSSAFERIANVAKSGDSVVFYIGTHGYEDGEIALFDKYYSSSELAADIARIPNDVAVVGVLMACHSETMLSSFTGETSESGLLSWWSNDSIGFGRRIGTALIASCRTDQLSFHIGGNFTGFGEFFIEYGLGCGYANGQIFGFPDYSGGNHDTIVTFLELAEYTAHMVPGKDLEHPADVVLYNEGMLSKTVAGIPGLGKTYGQPQAPQNLRPTTCHNRPLRLTGMAMKTHCIIGFTDVRPVASFLCRWIIG